MLSLTPRAADKVLEIREAESLGDQGLRVRVIGGGCSGFSYDLFFDPYRFNPSTIINNSVANAKFGTPLDWLRECCNNPQHAILTLATGILGAVKVVHSLRHHYTNVAHPSDDIKEMTVIEGGGRTGNSCA